MKVIGLLKIFFIGLIYSTLEMSFLLDSVNSLDNFQSDNNSYVKRNLDENHYIIDIGDVIRIEFENFTVDLPGIPEYTNNYKVRSDGSIKLPELGNLRVKGLSLNELEDLLTEKYKEFMYEQNINVYIFSYRDITFYLGGEVKKPGLYTFEMKNQEISDEELYGFTLNDPTQFKLFDAIKRGKGLTANADLSNIEIIRKNSSYNGGGKIYTTVSLLSLLQDGDQSVNIRVFDGDYIKVKNSEKIIPEQISLINKSNLTPDTISTYIIGNVNRPGSTIVKSGANLYEAIAAAGGASSQIGKIELIRFREDGKPEKKVIHNRPDTYVNSKNNPEIQDGDIITVRRNLLGKTTTALQEISSPFLSAYGLYNIFN